MTQNFNHDINLSLVLQDNEAIPEDIRPRFSLADKKVAYCNSRNVIIVTASSIGNNFCSIVLFSPSVPKCGGTT